MVTPSYALFSPTILMQRLVHPIRQKLQPELLSGHIYREELGGDVSHDLNQCNRTERPAHARSGRRRAGTKIAG